MERTVQVELGERSYPIRIGIDLLAKAGPEVVRATGATRAVVVSVPPVARRYGARLTRSLREAGLRVHRILVPDGDRTKNLRQAARLYDALLDVGADRSSVLVALGGGVVGDLTGFVAATFLRGIAYVQVPTTLLAMVDASVGGKTGVNLPAGKNLVGAFHQPRLVLADAATLASLPRRARGAGVSEVIKKAAIRDAGFFARLERDLEAILELDPHALLPAIERACEIKAAVVAEDERETGTRMLLNFGHTLAHAIERLAGYRRVLHGEAVSIGMAFAARRSESLGFAPAGTAERLVALLERAALPSELPDHPRRAYLDALGVDKKRRDAKIHFVVSTGIGTARTVPLLPSEILPARRGTAPRTSRARSRDRR
ncbi:MAG: 3-dehydroquinate synthase [Myxococcota bacterium]